jgi:hypothetical protein
MPTPEILVHANVLPKLTVAGGLRVREDTAFTDASGVEKSAVRKRAEQDLQQASEVLSRMLLPSEAVLYVARAAFMPNNWEQLMENHGATALGALLVITNHRLIVLRTKLKGFGGWVWDQGILTVEWTSLAQAAKKGWLIGYLDLKDQANRRERFFRLSWRDSKKLRLLLGALVPGVPGLSAAVAPGAPGFAEICPKCLAKLSTDLYRCAQCGQLFKDEKSLIARTLLVPGGSYFYTGQTFLGVVGGLFEGLFTLAVVVSALEGFGVITAPSDASGDLALVRATIWLAMLTFIKFASFYRARRRVKRFIPA